MKTLVFTTTLAFVVATGYMLEGVTGVFVAATWYTASYFGTLWMTTKLIRL